MLPIGNTGDWAHAKLKREDQWGIRGAGLRALEHKDHIKTVVNRHLLVLLLDFGSDLAFPAEGRQTCIKTSRGPWQ
jgi:hypothetical protein